jgi:hypothetical protein
MKQAVRAINQFILNMMPLAKPELHAGPESEAFL